MPDELLAPDMLDDPTIFPLVYADEELCECPDESELAVEVSGDRTICMNCGKRKI